MNKLTADKARHALAMLRAGAEQQVLSIKSEYMMQALEIALPVLEQQEMITDNAPLITDKPDLITDTYRQIENDGREG
ncbi:hypothetical protein K5Y32_07285 [Pantoea sp. DY-15]|uniref:hypothetical protein n=1 Tax=Pantoea sp. DY-15 TaxID=2871489 RepID=UPI001C97BA70|nr:hypothetical protein [Pantoea sp. DY-15]MBY4887735.1 hypothetical protein [Pantoea sp. DY-15]